MLFKCIKNYKYVNEGLEENEMAVSAINMQTCITHKN